MKIGTIQDQWNSGSTIETYTPGNIPRVIFPKVSGSYLNATTYTYSSDEWAKIQEEINLLFYPITRDVSGYVVTGGDYQNIQSNIGLLNYAAKETQDRLLRLERMVYGIDFPTFGATLTEQEKQKLGNHLDYLTDHGILRIIKELFKNEILVDTLYDSDYSTSVTSKYKDAFTELFGDYETEEDFNNISGNQDGKFHSAYFIYKIMKDQFVEQDESIKPDFTFLSKQHIYTNNYFKYDLPYLKNTNKKGILKDQSLLDNGNYVFFPDQTISRQLNGEYSAFGFINSKLSTAYSIHLSPIYYPNNITNYENLKKPFYKFILSENSNQSYNENLNLSLRYINKWGKYKDKYNSLNNMISQESNDNIPDNVIQYRFNSSGLSFNISGQLDEAEDINTKFKSTIKDQNTVQISGDNHTYVITYLGEFVFKLDYTKSEFHPENIVWSSGSLPNYGINAPTNASGFVTSVSLTGGPGSLPSLSVPSSVYVPEKIEITSGKLWLVDDYSVTEDNGGQGFKFSRYITDKDPDKGYISGIAYRPYINDFKLFGAHIPEEYDMLTKVRAQDHIVNQIHLTLQDDPINYPKEIKNMTTKDANYILFTDNKCLIYWEPINISNNYIIMQKKNEYWLRVSYTSVTAFVFDYQGAETEFKIIANVFNLHSSILDTETSLIDEFTIAQVKIPGNLTPNDDRTLLEANPDFDYLKI